MVRPARSSVARRGEAIGPAHAGAGAEIWRPNARSRPTASTCIASWVRTLTAAAKRSGGRVERRRLNDEPTDCDAEIDDSVSTDCDVCGLSLSLSLSSDLRPKHLS